MAKGRITHGERVQIVERHLKGESLKAIADSLGINKDTARKWWRRYRNDSWAGLSNKMGRPPIGVLGSFSSLIKYVVLRLKLQNPGWGLDVLLLHLSRRDSLKAEKLPGRTALHNYLSPFYHRFGTKPRFQIKRPEQEDNAPQKVHVRWQMDFKGYIKIKGLGNVAPFNICDEYSSAPLQSKLFTAFKVQPLTGVTWRTIQGILRSTFQRWGKPEELKMDRDPIFIGSSSFEWPGYLLLWLIGLGITPIINPRAMPTKNANVERCNKTWLYHVGMTTATHTVQSLQLMVDQAWEDRRCFLNSRNIHCKNQPPMVAFPELEHSKRPYERTTERQNFEMQNVYEYLSHWSWKRLVDNQGRICLGTYQPYVSRVYKGQVVRINLNRSIELFEVENLDGKILKQFSHPNISLDYLTQGV